MRCQTCGSADTRVKKTVRLMDTPVANLHGSVKMRRRNCRDCGRPFQTYEVHQEHYEMLLGLTGDK